MGGRIAERFLSKPDRLIALGRSCISVGFALILTGLLGQLALKLSSMFESLSHAQGTAKSLAAQYPVFPTWWIPESFLGAVPALMLICLGAIIYAIGQRGRRLIKQ